MYFNFKEEFNFRLKEVVFLDADNPTLVVPLGRIAVFMSITGELSFNGNTTFITLDKHLRGRHIWAKPADILNIPNPNSSRALVFLYEDINAES